MGNCCEKDNSSAPRPQGPQQKPYFNKNGKGKGKVVSPIGHQRGMEVNYNEKTG